MSTILKDAGCTEAEVRSSLSTNEGSPETQNQELENINLWSSKQIGDHGEQLACEYLKRRGYEIIERNWRCTGGEADIIAQDGDEIVLVEVKTRIKTYGDLDDILPELAVDGRKQRRYRRIALFYVASHTNVNTIRMDVIGISLRNASEGRIHHVISAFGWSE